MTSYLYANKIKIFDYSKFAAPLRELRNNAEQIAQEQGIKIQCIRKRHIQKEKIISDIIKDSGMGRWGWVRIPTQ